MNVFRAIVLLSICALLSQGCTGYHSAGPGNQGEFLEEINSAASAGNPDVFTRDGHRYPASGLLVRPDSSFWHSGEDRLLHRVPNADIDRIVIIDRKKGAGDAFLAGFIPVALFAGVAAIASSGGSGCGDGTELCLDPDPGALIFLGLSAAAVSGLVAVPVGYLVGHEDVYLFPDGEGSGRYAARGWRVTGGITEAKQVWDGRWPTSWFDSRNIEWTTGFHLGVHTEWIGTRNLTFSTGLSYEEKGFGYYHEGAGASVDYRYSYLSLPVLLRYRVEMRLWSPFFFAGPRVDYLVSRPDDPWEMSPSFKDLIYGLSLGGGLEFWSDVRLSFFIEYSYQYDLSPAAELRAPGSGDEARVTNKSYTISAGIGFK